MEVLGVDEHVWRHTRRGDRYVTVVIDLTPVRDRSGPARLLDVVPGRSKKVFKTWLAARGESWRERVEVVAMDGFTGSRERRWRACQGFCVSGLQVGGESVGVCGGGWARALYLVGGDLSFDELALGSALGGWKSFVLVAFSGSFVHGCRRSPATAA